MRRKLFLFSIIIFIITLLMTVKQENFWGGQFDELYGKNKAYTVEQIEIQHISSEKTVLTGKVVAVEEDRRKLKGKILINYYGPGLDEDSLWGAQIQLRGKIEEPAQRRNPGCFDYREYLLSRGIGGIIAVSQIDIVRKGTGLTNSIATMKHRFLDSLSQDCKGIVSGLLFGDKTFIEDSVYEEFRKNGTAHILAVSGLHIGILYSAIKKLTGKKKTVVGTLLISLTMVVYAFLAMWSSSVVRAAAMVLLREWGEFFDRKYDLITGAGTIGVIIILINPYAVLGTGFQMSFLAVISISFFTKLFPRTLPPSVKTMLAVNMGLVPYQIFQFNIFSWSSFIANIPIVYMTGIVMPVALIHFIVFSIFGEVRLIEVITEGLVWFMVEMNRNFSFWGYGSFNMTSMPLWSLILFYLLLFFLASECFYIMRERGEKKRIKSVILLFIVFSLLVAGFFPPELAQCQLVFPDVGQGDCVHLKYGKFDVLIDGGGSVNYPVGKETVMPYLLKNGVKKVDLAIGTHRHTDHYKGLEELKEERMIKDLLVGQIAGKKFLLSDNVWIETLWPLSIDSDKGQDENAGCSVFMIHYNGYRALITGDLDSQGEREMLKYYEGTTKLKADILKIGHHGSAGSTCDEFLDAVNPKYGVIQVGKNNYGHPSPKVIEKCYEKGIMIFRNDLHGAVGFDLSGERILPRQMLK